MTTLTNFRNNLFTYADEVKNKNKTIFVWKRDEKDFVVISFKEYKKLKEETPVKKSINNWFQKFAWIFKDSDLAKLNDVDLKNEIRDLKINHLEKKHLS